MKQHKPQRMVETIRTTPVLLPNSVPWGLGARSACVIAVRFGIFGVERSENSCRLKKVVTIRV